MCACVAAGVAASIVPPSLVVDVLCGLVREFFSHRTSLFSAWVEECDKKVEELEGVCRLALFGLMAVL